MTLLSKCLLGSSLGSLLGVWLNQHVPFVKHMDLVTLLLFVLPIFIVGIYLKIKQNKQPDRKRVERFIWIGKWKASSFVLWLSMTLLLSILFSGSPHSFDFSTTTASICYWILTLFCKVE